MANEIILGCFVDAQTGETVERELTNDELQALLDAQSSQDNERNLDTVTAVETKTTAKK